MIKSIIGTGYINISDGYASSQYISAGSPASGTIRYNSNMNSFEVNDGVSWIQLHGANPRVELNGAATMAINWALQKMEEERQLDELCKKYPGLDKARANYELFKRLVETEEQE